MSTRRLICRALTASAALLIALPLAAMAQDKVVLKLGWPSGDSAQDPYAVGARTFKTAVERGSRGRVEVQLFANRALGDEKQLMEGMRFGTADAGIVTNAVIAQIEPAYQVNDLPFLYANEAQAQRILDGAVGRKLTKKLESKGLVVLGYMEGGFRNMINNVRPVQKPEDVKGVKYRVMQNPVYIDMFSSLGGSAVPMAWAETFTAVQQGAVDGLEIPVAVVDQNKFYEVTKYLSLTNHTYSVILLLMSKRSFDKLPADLKPIVLEAGTTATGAQRQASYAAARSLVTSLESKGMKVNQVSDIAPFRKSVMPVYERFRKSIGPDIYNDVLAEVKKP